MMIRHPLTLVIKETRPLDIRVDNTCLLLQDLHSPFADPSDGWLARRVREKVLMREFEDYFQLLELITPNIPLVLEAVRGLGIRVLYSCLGHRKGESPSPFQEATGWTWDLDGPNGAYPEAWQPAQGEPMFSKPGWSALANPEFTSFLADNRIANVLVMGTMLDFGIRQTCIELSDRGIGSLIISDAAVALTREGQDYTADNIAHGLIKLRYTGEFLGLLEVLKQEGSVLI